MPHHGAADDWLRNRIVDLTAQVLSKNPSTVSPQSLAHAALEQFVRTYGPAFGLDSDARSTLFAAKPLMPLDNTREVSPPQRMARPPTQRYVVERFVSVGDGAMPAIHESTFCTTIAPLISVCPTTVAGTPAELYDVPGGTFETVYVFDVRRSAKCLRNHRGYDSAPRAVSSVALLNDVNDDLVITLLALPLVCPWFKVEKNGFVRRLCGHILMTSARHPISLAPLAHRDAGAREKFGLVLQAMAELIAAIFCSEELNTSPSH